jgi:hypothetical protein
MVTRTAGIRRITMGAAALSMIAAGVGCELIAGTETRQLASSAGGSAGSGGQSSSGAPSSTSASTGSGGGAGGSGNSTWPDSATPYCSDGTQSVTCPTPTNVEYHGQDGDYDLPHPTYAVMGIGSNATITDNVTGLV